MPFCIFNEISDINWEIKILAEAGSAFLGKR